MKRVCVYCGSGVGTRTEYADAARTLGRVLVQQGLDLVFGGGRIGMMGVLARTVLERGGNVIGVIPEALQAMELGLNEATELRVVKDMHERKATMAGLADGFIALPGGFGTMEEMFEILTWAQLALHTKPAGLLNAAGYFDHLIRFVDHATDEGFLDTAHRDLLLVDRTADGLLAKLRAYRRPEMDKVDWILRARLEQ
ncbi:MAG: TIGR00730 family Rossman fold protein [Phycisphaerales bacterium]|nr:MAG: TIGR00730 family Rossman fold protein [Phycisphaerales bacterium]